MSRDPRPPRVVVHSSHRRGNAPPGYLVVRVSVAPGLFVESELNPYTEYEFRHFLLIQGYEDDRDRDTVVLASFQTVTGALGTLFAEVRNWFVQGEQYFGVKSVTFKFNFGEA